MQEFLLPLTTIDHLLDHFDDCLNFFSSNLIVMMSTTRARIGWATGMEVTDGAADAPMLNMND
jgi:hypothetical protein